MSAWLRNNIQKSIVNTKKIFVLLVLANIIYMIMIFVTIPKVMSYSGGLKILDLMPLGYNHEYVNLLLNSLGSGGRWTYLYYQIPLDLFYPFLYGISYCLLLAFILKKLDKLEGSFIYLSLIPIFSAVCDYFENIGIIIMLNQFPNNSELWTQITNVFSVSKSTTMTIYFLILIYFTLRFLKRKFL